MQQTEEHVELLRQEARKVERSGALGRSRSYARLLEFLVECSEGGRTPKEVEIAIEVFGKGADFDPSQDSMVRVYAHNLRQKLEHYYATEGRAEPRHISLARGEYRVSLTANETEPAAKPEVAQAAVPAEGAPPTNAARSSRARLLIGALLLALGIVIGLVASEVRAPAPSAARLVAASPIWSVLFDDDLPILVVVGDYYIFGEVDKNG